MADVACRCFEPPFHYADFESRAVGVDETDGRFAEVTVERCCQCGQHWLRYFYEHEAFSRSGRWYRALLTPDEVASVTVASAVALLSARDWHFRGGSYFDSTGLRCDWRLDPQWL